MKEITTLALDILLKRLKAQPEQILAQIEADELIKRRTLPNGLTIANAGPQLFEPVWEHQLFAKGIVYTRDPYKVISLPLVKMYNHGMRELNDKTTAQCAASPGIKICFAEKLDGTMLQAFAYEGQVYLTTRSILEGVEVLGDDSPFLTAARQVLSERYPQLLDASNLEGKSLIFELIHPITRQVTNYGGRQDVVLLSIFDLEQHSYWSNPRVFEWAKAQGVPHPELVLTHDDLEAGIEQLRQDLASDERIPEGSIVCFERDGHIVHRVKVKTAEYLERFSMRYKITYKSVVDVLWQRPHMHQWELYLEELVAQSMSEEEVEAFYKAFFDEFMLWYSGVDELYQQTHAAVKDWITTHGELPDDAQQSRAYIKEVATVMRAKLDPELFPLVMHLIRKGKLGIEQVMWYRPAYPGFRDLLDLTS